MKASLARRTEQEWRCKSRRVRTHHSTSRVAVRRLGRIIQRIFLPNQEAALVEPFGNGLVRVGSQGLFSPYLFNQISDLQLKKKTAQSEVSLKQSTRLLKNKPPIITLYRNL